MRRVDIKVGFACNNHCKFCVQGRKRKIFSDKSTEEIKRILSDCRCEDIEGVVFTGGEPTIRKDLIDLVRYASSLKFKTIQIQTNGRMFSYMDYCRRIVDAGANEFSPAVHGPTAEIHDALTSAEGSFKETTEGIRNLKKLGQYVLTNTVVTSRNYKHLPEIAALLTGLGVDQYQFAFVHIVGSAALHADWIVPRKKEAAFYIKKGLEVGIKKGVRVMTEAMPYCFMRGYEAYVAESQIPDTKVYDFDLIVEDYGKSRANEGKRKHDRCRVCKHDRACEGPWKEYVELYGWSEFAPVT